MTEMGESLDTLVNTEGPTSSFAADDRVAYSVSLRIGAIGLSPLLEKDEEDEDWVGQRDTRSGLEDDFGEGFPLKNIWWFPGQQRAL